MSFLMGVVIWKFIYPVQEYVHIEQKSTLQQIAIPGNIEYPLVLRRLLYEKPAKSGLRDVESLGKSKQKKQETPERW